MTDTEQSTDTRYTSMQINQEKLRAILNSVVDGIISINKYGTIEAANPSAERMFGYSQGDSTKTRGTGLGLAIVKRYIETHGGTVGIEPSKTGTRFLVKLPLKPRNVD
ncbi:MAG: ATP-binding protein [Planctomycetaceae bacterium]|nr:ATP-binding protein [Planctomycetaceae bacterium]